MGPRTRQLIRAVPAALLCLLALVPAASVAGAPGTASGPVAGVKVVECQRGSTPAGRLAIFRAQMSRVSGAARMSLRFSLQESVSGARWRHVKAPGLGIWRRSRPDVGVFAYRQRVRALSQGSAYRVGVAYRWQDAGGQVVKTVHRRSRPCRQFDPLPNLRVQRIGGKPADAPERTRYAVSVVNAGPLQSEATDVALTVNGGQATRAGVPALAPGQVTRVFVEGPRCTSGVSAQADPDDAVRETNEFDNGRAAACPPS